MHRTITWVGTATLALTLLAAGAGPADAAGTTIVRGHAYGDGSDFTVAGPVYWESSCDYPLERSPEENDVYGFFQRGGAAGTTQAIGWGVDQERTGGEFGLLAKIDDPRSLNYLVANVDATGTGAGDLVAFFRGDGGWYIAHRDISAAGTGWGLTPNYATQDLSWNFLYDDGTWDEWAPLATIAEIAVANPDLSYGRAGPLFGCNGEEYAIDNLAVGTDDGVTTYDFQGLGPSKAHTAFWTGEKWLRDKGSATLDYGGAAFVGGDGTLAQSGDFYFDNGGLYEKRYGSSTWRPVGDEKLFTEEAYAVFKVRPERRTSYRFATAGIVADPSVSAPFVLEVRARVKARTSRKQVRKGERIVINGTYDPRNRGVRVGVQRKVASRWREVAQTRTSRRGTFTLRPTATSVGKWTLRVVAANGGGNLGNKTRTFVVEVKPKPPPPKPCGSCGGDSTSGTDPSDPPDQPVYNPPDPGGGSTLPDVFRTRPSRPLLHRAPLQRAETSPPAPNGNESLSRLG